MDHLPLKLTAEGSIVAVREDGSTVEVRGTGFPGPGPIEPPFPDPEPIPGPIYPPPPPPPGPGPWPKPIKPGWQTTEFWITIATTLIAILCATGVVSPKDASKYTDLGIQVAGVIAMVVAQFGYAQVRGRTKGGGSPPMPG